MTRKINQYTKHTISKQDIAAVVNVLQSDYLTSGPHIDRFEEALAKQTSAVEAVVLSSATAALHLAYHALGLKDGDVIIVPAITFLATANAGLYCGAQIAFADVHPETGVMEVEHLEQSIQNLKRQNITAKAVVCVHMNGQGGDLKALSNCARNHDLLIIEDACHALGGSYQNQMVGSGYYSDAAIFSFHASKTITMGEGGAVCCGNTDLANKIRKLRNHGMEWENTTKIPWLYHMNEVGYNYRASSIHCALGLSQLDQLSNFIKHRDQLIARYRKNLHPHANWIRIVPENHGWKPAWHLCASLIEFDQIGMSRENLMIQLKNKSIGTQVHYRPLTHQPYYQKNALKLPEYSGAEHYFKRQLTLPLHNGMTEQDVDEVTEGLIACPR